MEAVEVGRQRVVAAGGKFDRPNDYFAEMVKTDDHMARIRQRMANETVRIKRSEDAARQRALKKYGKQAQAEKLQERAKAKTAELEKLKMIRKGRHTAPSPPPRRRARLVHGVDGGKKGLKPRAVSCTHARARVGPLCAGRANVDLDNDEDFDVQINNAAAAQRDRGGAPGASKKRQMKV